MARRFESETAKIELSNVELILISKFLHRYIKGLGCSARKLDEKKGIFGRCFAYNVIYALNK